MFETSLRYLLRYYSGYPYLTSNRLEHGVTRLVKCFIYEKRYNDNGRMDAPHVTIAYNFAAYVEDDIVGRKPKKPMGFL